MLIKTDPDIIQSYFEDESGLLGGHAELVCFPKTEEEIRDFLLDAAQRKMPVTVSGAGTGVTGGRIPFGGSVLSLENFNKIISINKVTPHEGCAVVQPGVSVRSLKEAVQKEGWMYPPVPTEQSSWIGGNVSTNASGSRGFKYGPTRSYIRRMRILLTTGDILDIKRSDVVADQSGKLRIPTAKGSISMPLPSYRMPRIKNAAGYYTYPGMDLLDLFIGQEGTLGVVTEIEVALLPLVTRTLGGIAFFPKRENAWDFVAAAKEMRQAASSGVDPMSLEYFDRNALDLLKSDYPHIPQFADAAIFFEQAMDSHDETKSVDAWSKLLETHQAPLEDVWFAMTSKDQESFREFRHRLPEKVNEIVAKNKFPKTGTDIAVPAEQFRSMLLFYEEKLKSSGIRHLMFGHIGESHMHANLLPATESEFAKSKQLYLELVERAVQLGGTVSAEHGIGKLKHAFLEKMVGKAGLMEMARVKQTLEPACILGRGNIFSTDYLPAL